MLDSVYPLSHYIRYWHRSGAPFGNFFGRCAADASCNALIRSLRGVFFVLVTIYTLHLRLFSLGRVESIGRVYDLLIDVLFVACPIRCNSFVPKMIYDIARGNYDILRERRALYFDTLSSPSVLQMSVQCAEEIPFRFEKLYSCTGWGRRRSRSFLPSEGAASICGCGWTAVAPDPRENLP